MARVWWREAGVAALAIVCGLGSTTAGLDGLEEIRHSRYRLVGPAGPLGWTELTDFRRPDGSRSYLARERMEFWGPVLDRFVVLTFDPKGHFDSGHWVGTSEYSAAFSYTFRFDGRAIRGDWQDSVRGRGWTEVPSRPENPVMGFWGPLEGRLLARFDPAGPDRQTFEAVDVEDSHHRLLDVTVERVGLETVEVPAGRFNATHFRSERFGRTDHWVDADGTLLRWASEQGTYRWDLERYPSADPPDPQGQEIARGVYDVMASSGPLLGTVPWRLVQAPDGDVRIFARESLEDRTSRFEGVLDKSWHWKGTSETARWLKGEGDGPPEIHHLETFFHREQVHLLRFRDRAYPLLQSRDARAPVPFYALDYPISALTWLRGVARVPGKDQTLSLAHISNRYRGGGLEIHDARIAYLGTAPGASASRAEDGHHFMLRYPGGWQDVTADFWTDSQFVPYRVKLAADGEREYRLRDYRVTSAQSLRPSDASR